MAKVLLLGAMLVLLLAGTASARSTEFDRAESGDGVEIVTRGDVDQAQAEFQLYLGPIMADEYASPHSKAGQEPI